MGGHSAIRLPLRVVHIASGDLYAGAEVQLYQLVRQLHRSHVTVSVILLNEGLLAERLRAEKVPVLVLDENRHGALYIAWRIWRFLRTQRPDIVHTHRHKENLLGALAAAFTSGARSLRTVHGADEAGSGKVSLLKVALNKLDLFMGRFFQAGVVAVSHDLAERLRRDFPGQKIHLIPNGIDSALSGSADSVAQSLRSTPGPKIAFVGRLATVKRPDLFVLICQAFLELGGQTAEFYILGDGPLRNQIRELSRNAGVDKRMHLVGFVEDAASWLCQMDALLIPSDDEGTPMVLLEAMTLGVPVMAHAVGGIPEVLDNGKYGCLMDSQDPQQWARELAELLFSPKRAERTRQARERVLQVYTAEVCAQAHLELYAKIMDPAAAPPLEAGSQPEQAQHVRPTEIGS